MDYLNNMDKQIFDYNILESIEENDSQSTYKNII